MVIPKFIWESAVQLNEIFGFHSNLSRFGSDQLTKIALLDISEAQENLNYRPMKKIDDSFTDINNWINSIGGWKVYRSFSRGNREIKKQENLQAVTKIALGS